MALKSGLRKEGSEVGEGGSGRPLLRVPLPPPMNRNGQRRLDEEEEYEVEEEEEFLKSHASLQASRNSNPLYE